MHQYDAITYNLGLSFEANPTRNDKGMRIKVVMTMNEKRALHFCLYTNEVGVLWYCTAFDSTKLRRTVLYAVTVLLCSTVRYGTA